MTRRAAWSRSIAAQVWLMVVVCALVLVGLIVVNARAEVRNERADVATTLERQGSSLASTLAEDAHPEGGTIQTMSEVAAQPAISEAGKTCPAALGTIQRAVENGYLAVVDGTGTVLCSAAPDFVGVGEAAFSAVPAVRKAASSGTAGLDGPFTDPRSGKLLVLISVPIEGRPGTALVFFSDSQDYFAPIGEEFTGSTAIAVDTRTGTLAMHFPPQPEVLGTDVRNGSLADALSGGGRLVTSRGLDGATSLYRSFRVEGTPYALLVGISEEDAYASVRLSLRRNALVGTLLILAMVVMGLLLQRRVARPARALRAAIAALADSADATDAPTDGPTELAEVARAFNAATDARRRADGLSHAILQHASDLVLVLSAGGRVVFAGPAARTHLGVEVGDSAGALAERLHPDDLDRVAAKVAEWIADGSGDLQLEAQAYDRHGNLRVLDARVQDLRGDRYVEGLVVTCRDVTERKLFEQHLSHQALHDPLTGLANRAAVLEHLIERLGGSAPGAAQVYFIDLDRFKLINDSHGHAIGDKVLVALSRKLRDLAGAEALVGRFGGDEFVVVTSQALSPEGAEDLAARIRRALEEPLSIGRRELFVTGSVGIATARPGDRPEVVLRNADTAMYRAKAKGRNCSAVFDEAMREEAQRLLRTENDLHRALERDQLVVHFQPLVTLQDGRVEAVEALVRWNHPHHGLVPPGDFIPVAEETGLVVPIGAWVLNVSCCYAAETGARLGRPLAVSVNISPRQLSQPDIVELVETALQLSGLPAGLLTLEVTESVLVQDADAAGRTLRALHDRGVRISIDDFGTGWSSLTYLQQFPVDEIKLDRSFVSKVDQDATSRTIVGALIGMAHAMDLRVVAEGVEREEQAAFLAAHGCDTAQGWLFSPAVTGAELEARLAAPLGLPALPALRRRPADDDASAHARREAG